LVRSVAKDRQRGRAYELDPRPRLEPITHQHYVGDLAEPVHERIACGACSRIHRAAAKAELPRSAASRDCQVAKTFLVLTTRSTRTRLYFLLQRGSLMHLRHLLSTATRFSAWASSSRPAGAALRGRPRARRPP